MKKIFTRIQNFISGIPTPIAILGLTIIAYGLFIPWQGFYLDDWYIILYQDFVSATDFSGFFYQDRPLFGYVYQVFIPIFKDSRLAWQIFTIFTHALAASVYWWLLVKLLPSRKRVAAAAAFLFVVYPGFQSHWFSVMYGQVFTLMAIYFLSYILMIESVRKTRFQWLFILGAVICQIIGIVPQETFLGIELVRPLVLFLVIKQQTQKNDQSIKRSFLWWIPYFAVLIAFVCFRLGETQSYSYQASAFSLLKVSPVHTVLDLLSQVFWGCVDSIFRVWLNLVNLLKRDLLSSVTIVMLFLIGFGFAISLIILGARREESARKNENGWIMVFGLVAAIGAMAPFLAGLYGITLEFPKNRFLIAIAPGACLFLVAFIEAFWKTNKLKIITFSLLIGFAVGAQFINARSMMLIWQAQQDFFWQLSWRIPQLKPNTALVTDDLPFSKYYSGPSLTSPLNLIYAPDTKSNKIPYLLLLISQQDYIINSFEPDSSFESNFRSFEFDGNTSEIVLFKKYAEGCLHVLPSDYSLTEFLYNPRYSFWQEAIPLSNLDQIVTDEDSGVIPPEKYFGKENKDQWCYYFEKADLARQQQQWSDVIQNYETADQAGFSPQVDSEWVPLIEAYLQTGKVDQAVSVTRNITDHDQTNTAELCKVWTAAMDDENVLPFAEEILTWLNCRVLYEE